MTHDKEPENDTEQTDVESSPPSERPEPKKERVLHTRIPAVLESELKTAAAALRMPVSNLVRAILEDAVAIADRATERVEDRLQRVAKSVHDERGKMRARVERKERDALADVVAYQNVVMAKAGECARCGSSLAKGDDAAICVFARPGPTRFVCPGCMHDEEASDKEELS